MGLLYPFALLIGLAAAGPVILHYWRRQKEEPPNVFPGVFFLVDPAVQRPREAKPLTWLLTLLRVALILLLALIAAAPYVHSNQRRGLPTEPVLLGLVIDDSPSMSLPMTATGSQTRLDRALDEAGHVIDGLPPGSAVVWTTTSGKYQPLQFLADGDHAAQHPHVPVTDASGDVGRAFDRVTKAIEEFSFPNRELVVVTDGTVGVEGLRTREHFQTALSKAVHAGIGCTVLQIPIHGDESVAAPANPSDPPPSVGFVAPRLKVLSVERPSVWRSQRPVTLTARVLFDAAPDRRVTKLRWSLGNDVLDQDQPMSVQSVDLPCGLRLQSFEIVHDFPQAGWWRIQVAAGIDPQRQDTYTTFLDIFAPTPVWLVEPPEVAGGSAVGDSRFLALAIDPVRGGGGGGAIGSTGAAGEWALVRKSYADLRGELPENGVLVLWGAGRGLDNTDWNHIASAVARGMGVWFVPDGGALPDNRDHAMLFWTADKAELGGSGPRVLPHRVPLSVVPIRGMPENSIRSALQACGSGLFEAAGVERYYRVRPADAGAITVVAIDDGQDQLHSGVLEMAIGRGIGVLLTAPPVQGNGTLVSGALWPLLTDLVLERIAPSAGDWPDLAVGERLEGCTAGASAPPFTAEVFNDAGSLPAFWENDLALGQWQALAKKTADESRPVSHFFGDGRFQFMGTAPVTRGALVLHDQTPRVVGVQSAQIPPREWDDTLLDAGFFATGKGSENPAGARVAQLSNAGAFLNDLRENEGKREARGEIAVTMNGDLTPVLLLLIVALLAPWMYLETREYAAA